MIMCFLMHHAEPKVGAGSKSGWMALTELMVLHSETLSQDRDSFLEVGSL